MPAFTTPVVLISPAPTSTLLPVTAPVTLKLPPVIASVPAFTPAAVSAPPMVAAPVVCNVETPVKPLPWASTSCAMKSTPFTIVPLAGSKDICVVFVFRSVTFFTNPLEGSLTVVSRAATFPSTPPTRPSKAVTVSLSAFFANSSVIVVLIAVFPASVRLLRSVFALPASAVASAFAVSSVFVANVFSASVLEYTSALSALPSSASLSALFAIAAVLSLIFLVNPFVSSPTVSFNVLIFVLFTSITVALSFVFFTSPLSTPPTVFLISSTAVLFALPSSSASTFVVVYTSVAVLGVEDSSTCTVPSTALATPNPPQRRESAIRDARRERLVTPPNFSRACS